MNTDTMDSIRAALKEINLIEDIAEYKKAHKAVSLRAAKMLNAWGFKKQYRSDGLSGRGQYWIHLESGIRCGGCNEAALKTMYAATKQIHEVK